MNKRLLLAVLCFAFTIRTPGEAQEIQKQPVALTWNYDGQQKKLTLHLANNSGKDITAYNISIAEKYADGSTDYADGRPNDIHDHQRMEDLLSAVVNSQLTGNSIQNGNGTFAAGTTRDQVIPETKDISGVEAIVDMVIYVDRTTDVQNEQAFRQLLAVRKGQLLAVEKVNEIITRVLADPMVSSPISVTLTELTQLADSLGVKMKNSSLEDPEANQATHLRGAVQNLQGMQRSQMRKPEVEQLKEYVAEQEKRIALMSPHCQLGLLFISRSVALRIGHEKAMTVNQTRRKRLISFYVADVG
jgi:hypothetical protein